MTNDVNAPTPIDAGETPAVPEALSSTPADAPASQASTEEPRPTPAANETIDQPESLPSSAAEVSNAEAEPNAQREDTVTPDAPSQTGDTAVPSSPSQSDSETSGEPEKPKKKPRKKKKKPAGPTPAQVLQRIGTSTEAAMAYVAAPEQAWQKLSSGFLEELITDLPPVTAAALLGPEALCRHFLASAATGRYRDLFYLWDLFKAYPEQCKPILMSRTEAQERAKHKLRVATEFGLIGSANRVAEDIDRAQGLPWNWIREILLDVGPLIAQRPAVIAALWRKDPDWVIDLPEEPDQRWLSEAAALHAHSEPVPEAIEAILGQHLDSLPTTPSTLALAAQHHPDRVGVLLERIDPDAPDVVATVRWARDHGHDVSAKLFAHLEAVAQDNRAKAAALWAEWTAGGIAPETLPDALLAPNLEGLDIGAPETWDLAAILVDRGVAIDAQAIVDGVAATNRQVAEKAYEAAVCAGFAEVHLPAGLASNPNIKADARCPKCAAWTWVRPKHETRCPRSAKTLDEPAATPPAPAAQAVDTPSPDTPLSQ
ncbi:hypothetical protein [Stomatohabitans albus]|uniref:hypothetical protein n=1 Tax=Stomatohabitans albus TaxID=3110766 RepID=UPI00300C466E